jgi:hypothetical protein
LWIKEFIVNRNLGIKEFGIIQNFLYICNRMWIDGIDICGICISAEDDTDSFGSHSLIDCLYHLKQVKNKIETNKEHSIIIEQMTNDEIEQIYGH